MPGVSIPVFEKVFIEYVQLWQYNKVVANKAQCSSLSFYEQKKVRQKWKEMEDRHFEF